MSREDLYKSFLKDPLLIEKNLISIEDVSKLRITDRTNIKLLEVIKIAISANAEGESVNVISRKINQYLNK